MNVYRDDYDWFIAESEEDLKALLAEWDYDYDPGDWWELDPESPLTIWYYTAEEVPGQALVEIKDERFFATMRLADWVNLKGRGLLCSTEV